MCVCVKMWTVPCGLRASETRRGAADYVGDWQGRLHLPSLTAHLPYTVAGRKKKLKEGNGDCIDVSSIQCSIIPGNTWQYLAIHNAIYNGI